MENKKLDDNKIKDSEQEIREKETKIEKKSETKKEKLEKKKKPLKKEKAPIKTYIFFTISIIVLGVSFFFYNKYVLKANEIPVKKISYKKDVKHIRKTKKVTIYYPNKDLNGLISSEVEISDENFVSEVNSIFINIKSNSNYLVKGEGEKYHAFMDSSITILNTYLVGDKLYINLSPNVKKMIYSKEQELLVLYSLVNTYTTIPGINKVKFLIDGNEVGRLRWYSLRFFYTKNNNI